MKKREVKKEDEYSWYLFARSYFLLATLACQELLSEKLDSEKYSSNPDNYYQKPYKVEELYVSVLFNIKQGIEIILKNLNIFADGEYEEGHDINKLFKYVRQRLEKIKLGQEEKEDFKKSLNEFENLVKYFYELSFLTEKISSNFVLNDKMNDVFRYPENKAEAKIDWLKILDPEDPKVDIDDIKIIKQKIDSLRGLISKTTFKTISSRPLEINVVN